MIAIRQSQTNEEHLKEFFIRFDNVQLIALN